MGYWTTVRTCCGAQASIARRVELHGLPSPRPSYALDRSHCELYDLDAVEDALFETPLWRAQYKLRGHDFSEDQGLVRGKCCQGDAATREGGFDWRGVWKPTPGEGAVPLLRQPHPPAASIRPPPRALHHLAEQQAYLAAHPEKDPRNDPTSLKGSYDKKQYCHHRNYVTEFASPFYCDPKHPNATEKCCSPTGARYHLVGECTKQDWIDNEAKRREVAKALAFENV